MAAGTLGEQAAARLRLRNRGETPAPAALWASRVAGLAGFREPLCSSLPPRCWDLQVSCALFQDPLYPTFRLATTSLFSRRAGRVPACGRGLCELLGARSHPHSTLSFNSWPLCRSLWRKGSLLYPSHDSRSPGNRKLETASSRPSDINAPATGGLAGGKILGELSSKHSSLSPRLCSPATQTPSTSLGEPRGCSVPAPPAPLR